MIVDSRGVQNNETFSADFCIIGAGAAGIVMAMDLAKKNYEVIVLESGGFDMDPETQSLCEGDNVGINYVSLDKSRSRYFGGNTNCWGGWCRPLDEIDFEKRDWVPNSGWPFGRAELEPWYVKSHQALQIDDSDYSLEYNQIQLKQQGLETFPLSGRRIENIIDRFSVKKKFGEEYRKTISDLKNVRAFLYANVTSINANEAANRIVDVEVATLNAKALKFTAKAFVLAAGGIENPRLLLASDKVEKHGIGNGKDLVGRYFMDHPRFRTNLVSLTHPVKHRRLYDATVSSTHQYIGNTNGRVAAHVALTEASQRRYRLPNTRTYFKTKYYPKMVEMDGYKNDLKRSVKWWLKYKTPAMGVVKKAVEVAPHVLRLAPQAALGLIDAQLNYGYLKQSYSLESVIEPVPNPDSRVRLSNDRDRLGQRRAIVNWRLTDLDFRNFESIVNIVYEDLTGAGVISGVGRAEEKIDYSRHHIEGCFHHMGTTRMGETPETGVVDPDCRVFGYDNLYIAGSSVAPTVGADMPTITLIALAFRLSAHLQGRF